MNYKITKKEIVTTVGIGLLVFLCVILFNIFHKPNILINNYIDYQEKGYDGFGTLQVTVDYDKIIKDLKLSESKEKEALTFCNEFYIPKDNIEIGRASCRERV